MGERERGGGGGGGSQAQIAEKDALKRVQDTKADRAGEREKEKGWGGGN